MYKLCRVSSWNEGSHDASILWCGVIAQVIGIKYQDESDLLCTMHGKVTGSRCPKGSNVFHSRTPAVKRILQAWNNAADDSICHQILSPNQIMAPLNKISKEWCINIGQLKVINVKTWIVYIHWGNRCEKMQPPFSNDADHRVSTRHELRLVVAVKKSNNNNK